MMSLRQMAAEESFRHLQSFSGALQVGGFGLIREFWHYKYKVSKDTHDFHFKTTTMGMNNYFLWNSHAHPS
jgi:hypothetical protein